MAALHMICNDSYIYARIAILQFFFHNSVNKLIIAVSCDVLLSLFKPALVQSFLCLRKSQD